MAQNTPTACRFGFTIQESGNPLEKVSRMSSPQEKGSRAPVGHSSRKASLGKEGNQALMHIRPFFTHFHCTMSSEGTSHYITSDLQKASSFFIVQAKSISVHYSSSVELQELPSLAPRCSRAQHPSQASHDRG